MSNGFWTPFTLTVERSNRLRIAMAALMAVALGAAFANGLPLVWQALLAAFVIWQGVRAWRAQSNWTLSELTFLADGSVAHRRADGGEAAPLPIQHVRRRGPLVILVPAAAQPTLMLDLGALEPAKVRQLRIWLANRDASVAAAAGSGSLLVRKPT